MRIRPFFSREPDPVYMYHIYSGLRVFLAAFFGFWAGVMMERAYRTPQTNRSAVQ